MIGDRSDPGALSVFLTLSSCEVGSFELVPFDEGFASRLGAWDVRRHQCVTDA